MENQLEPGTGVRRVCRALVILRGTAAATLLYGLLPEFSKQGYATEAARAVINYAFNELNFKYLTAACNPEHQASRKVCERLHMQLIAEKEIDGQATAFYRIDK